MSYGNDFGGGRTRMRTKVFLNLYDLSPANDYLFPIGLGLHHSGIEIAGREYSYGSGGSGIFEHTPRDAPGARFRCQIELGSYDGGSKELNQALDDLRSSSSTSTNGGGGFGPDGYNLIRKNCNHFCNALSWRLLRTTIPPYINRLADVGNCCSCLLPKQLLTEGSPVGGGNQMTGSSQSSFIVPTRTSMNRGGVTTTTGKTDFASFAGKGHSLGTSTSTGGLVQPDSSSSYQGLLSRFSRSSIAPSSSTGGTAGTGDDLTDRREKARKAALARLERNHPQSSHSSSSSEKQS